MKRRKRYAPFPRHFGIHRPMRGRPLFWEYEDLPVEAEEFWGFRFNRKPKCTDLELDEINVAGALLVSLIIVSMLGLDFEWAPGICAVLKVDAAREGWCKWKNQGIPFPPADRAKTTTCDDYIGDLNKLTTWEVLQRVCPDADKRMFFSYFSVPKACRKKARAIANCKVMGKYFGPPPPMRLITPKTLFSLMSYFPSPHFADLDFRHWFYQIPLPNEARPFFTTWCVGQCFELKVWSMGFKWTPAVAQAITMTIGAQAIRDAGFAFTSPTSDSEEIPPYWIITAVHKECKRVNATIKTDENGGNGIRKWDDGHVQFLGVNFYTNQRVVQWTHADVGKWAHLNPHLPQLTRADVAEMVGVIIWHWTLTNTRLVTIREVLKIASDIGYLCVTKADWKKDAELGVQQRRALEKELEKVRKAADTKQFYQFDTVYFDACVMAASDSSQTHGAAMFFNITMEAIIDDTMWAHWCETRCSQEDSYRSWWAWSPEEEMESINRKEIWAALNVVDMALEWKQEEANEETWLVPIAVDNTTAVSALTTWHFPADEKVAQELESRFHECERLQLLIMPVQVKSEEEAADDNTRGKESSVERRQLSLQKLRWAIKDSSIQLPM